MKKKALSVLLTAAMGVSMLAACGAEEAPAPAQPVDTQPTAQEPTDSSAVSASAIPTDYKYYYSFDAADDKAEIQSYQQTIGGDPILSPIDKEKKYIPGVKGDAIYTDGVTGYRLSDFNGVGDAYTLSFWMYATRFSNYMPSLQFGPDVHGDATGGQKYLNITRAEWSGEGTFPCIWSYDQLDNALWPAWADANTGEPMKQWVQIALVVDPNKVSADGAMLEAKLYINGQEWITKDSDGNQIYPNIVKGTMSPSDNFDMLVGINYWDGVFKGAFDELYVYDYCLDAGQIAAIYADGNPNAAYEEPERIINITADPAAIESIGKIDCSNEMGESVSAPIAIADGQTMQITMKSWSDGKDPANNYRLLFQSGDQELAAVNADMTGYFNGDASQKIEDAAFTWSWGNWNTWEQSVMVETDVTALITREGNQITVKIDNVDYNKTSNTAAVTFEIPLNDADLNVCITNGHCYTDILGTKDKTVRANGVIVGNTDCTTGWWSAFSDIFEIPEGQSVTKNFTNYNDGGDNWHNFVCILQNTPTGHGADQADGYAEYAVVRADNFGWGAGYDGIAAAECDWNWDSFMADMDGAKIAATITNNGATADINIVATTADGTEYHQNYTGIATNGPLYACFSCEASYLSFEAPIVGNTDCSTGWWSAFSDITAVAKGESKTINFKNFNDGGDNWHNFVCILQNTPTGHGADQADGYAEYAVVRADNFGWGAGYDGIAAAECDWDWATFMADMDGASIALTVTNNDTTADITFAATSADGTVHNQSYTGIAVDGDLYFCLSCEASYLVIE